MDWFRNLRNLKVEITSYCNAACPGCTRNITGGKTVNNLDLGHMDLDLWTRLSVTDTAGIPVRELLLDGNVGDFCMHPQALEFLQVFMSAHPETEVLINTNGGARSVKFWSTLGEMLSQINHRVNFAIDGLEDTHHIHRRRTTYEMVTRNMQAFIDAGGRANWVYTAFDHNIHQIAEAEQRAKTMNCSYFEVRQSCIPGEDMYTKTEDEEYSIGTDLIDSVPERLDKLIEEKYLISMPEENSNSPCNAYREKQIQIDWLGNVWPCSYIYSTEVKQPRESLSPFYMNEDQHPQQAINLNNYSLTEILKNNFYQDVLPDAIKNVRWQVCQERCDLKCGFP
jgi:MoaA/NifB/PqqE/SkfB family radical SAM enzyme